MPTRLPSSEAPHRSGIWRLVNAREMQALDRRTIEGAGIPGEVLMESAGRALVGATLRLRRRARRPGRPILVLCGGGNNGGDGFVLVRHLHGEGIDSEALLVGDPARLPPDAALNWERLARVGARHRVAAADLDWTGLLGSASVVVDALFGTGLARPVEGRMATPIEALAALRGDGPPVLSVDVPSGICADTGQVLGVAVEADATLTISLPKLGLALEPGRSHAGEVEVARVGIADPDPGTPGRVELWNALGAAAHLPGRPAAGHKGSFGHVLIAAGSPGKMGAAGLAARAAVRAGAGLVTVAHPAGLEAEGSAIPIEAMSQGVPSTPAGGFAAEAEKPLVELAAARDVLALGPGLGREVVLRSLVPRLVSATAGPVVIDADGLNALHGQLASLRERSAPTVLTPHPGEAAHLLDREARDLNRDRLEAARSLAERSGCVVLLKGAASVVADPEGRALVVPTGGPSLATGGTGDVLTGIVAALLARGLEAREAAGLAAWWHGATADGLARADAPFGLLAHELADALPECAAALLEAGEEEGDVEDLVLRFPGP